MDDDEQSHYCDGSLQDSEKVERRSVSEEGKRTSVNDRLWIRLKIPGKSGDQLSGEESVLHDDGHQSPTAKDDEPCRICSVCNKGFSSGKALGGHMRIHVQANNKDQLHLLPINNNKKKKKKKTSVNAGGSPMNIIETKPTCSLCSKNFPSMKSLFGHMRCHPEREWRGIQPPSAAKNSTSSSTVSDALVMRKTDTDTDTDDHIDSATTTTAPAGSGSVVDLSGSLSRWSATAKRGRKSTTASTSAPPPSPPPPPLNNGSSLGSVDHIIPDVVYDLMMLAQGDDHKQRVDLSEATNSNSLTNKAGNQESECVPPLKKKRRIDDASLLGCTRNSPTKKLKIEERGCVDADVADVGNSNAIELVMTKMERIKGKVALLEESHQFLPEKPVVLTSSGWEDGEDRTKEESESKDIDGSIPGEEVNLQSCRINGKMMKKKRRRKMKLRYLETVGDLVINAPPVVDQIPADRYKCSTCNKSFLTHQALGGHRSSHNKVKMINTMDEDRDEHYANPTADQVDETEECEEAAGSSRGLVVVATAAAAAAPHQCQICNKTFPTGQALGGHKRCHWNSPVEAQAASPGEASHNGRRILSFDLNEPPAMEDEESGIDSAFTQPHQHAASSSYNSVI